jgi:hypothetical protein
MKTPASSDLSYSLLVVTFVSISVWVHFASGYTFPVPWPDEAVFVQQAVSFQQHGSLYSPSLSDVRSILWMPPGYMVLLGILFKVFGSGLFVARCISLVLTLASLALLAWILRVYQARFHFLVLAGLLFLDRFFVITANVARMESLLILGIVGAIALFHERKSGAALMVLLGLPLIHPNGFYFVCAGLVFILVQKLFLNEEMRFDRSAKWILALVLILGTGYLLYAASHWSEFLRDMAFQFARKSRRNLIAPFSMNGNLIVLLVTLITIIVGLIRKEGRVVLFAVFSLSFWFVNRIGQEMWYQVFDAMAGLMLVIALIQLLNPARKQTLYTLLTLVALYIGIQLELIERAGNYPHSMRWFGMRPPVQVDYFRNDDAQKIRKFMVEHQKGSQPLRTMVYPSGDALFLQEMEGKVLRTLYVAQDTSVFPAQKHDLYLVHVSQYSPIGWDWSFLPWVLEDAKIDTSDKRNLLFERDGTEQWYYRFTNTIPDSISSVGRAISPAN